MAPGDDEERRPTGSATSAPGLTIAHEDEHLLVVDKPAGMVVHPARGHREGTLAQILAGVAAGGEPDRAGIVHRLDRDTSGLLLVAKDEQTHKRLQSALAQRQIRREYLALLEGRPPSRTGTIQAPIGRDPRVRTRMTVGGRHARPAETDFTVEQELGGVTLVRVRLQTGRTHQIRVHMRAIGHPVCGDPEYGTPGMLGLRRQFLHAARLELTHPLTGERLEVRSELPPDLAEALLRASERVS